MTITVDNLMPLKTYIACRKEFQPGLAAHRRRRTVLLGEHMRVQFEDEMTLRYQILEMLRVEHVGRIVDLAAIRHEIDSYAHLLPRGGDWKATLLLQYPDDAQRHRELPLLAGVAQRMYVKAEGYMPVFATANADLANDTPDTRPSAVHFLHFPFPALLRKALIEGAPVMLGCDHPRYRMSTSIAPHTLESLRADLRQRTEESTMRAAQEVPA